jgi:hypothetical protein
MEFAATHQPADKPPLGPKLRKTAGMHEIQGWCIHSARGRQTKRFQRENAKRRKRLEALPAPTSGRLRIRPLPPQCGIGVDRLGTLTGKGAMRRFRPFAAPRSNRKVRPNCDIGREFGASAT